MLALAAPLKARLQCLPQLTGWAVRTNLEEVDRSTVPAVDVRCVGASLSGDRRGAATLLPAWQITLVVRRSADAAEQLDQALIAVLQALQGWKPAGWDPLSLQVITEPIFAEEGLVGYQLTYSTTLLVKGQP